MPGSGLVAEPGFAETTPGNGEINTRLGGRGLYFADPDGHLMEIMTVPE